MKKYVLLACLLSLLGVKDVLVNQEKNIVQALLTEEKHFSDDLPVEMQQEIASWIMLNLPMKSFILKELGRVHTPLAHHSNKGVQSYGASLCPDHFSANYVSSANFNHAGTRIITSSFDGTSKIWDVVSGNCLHLLTGHTDRICSGHFDHSGERVITSSVDKAAKIWDVVGGTCLSTFAYRAGVHFSFFNPAGDKILALYGDGIAKIWDVSTGRCLHTLEGHSGYFTSGQFNGTGDKVIIGSIDSSASIWDVEKGTCLHALELGSECCGAEFNARGDKALVICMNANLMIWDVETGKCLRRPTGHKNTSLCGKSLCCAHFNRSGDMIVTASDDCTAKVWDSAHGKCLHTLVGHGKSVKEAHFNSLGNWILTASEDATVKIWDVSTGSCLFTLYHSSSLRSAKFNEAGDKIITIAGSDEVKIWDVKRFAVLKRFLETEITHKQALLLVALYETVICRALVKRHAIDAFIAQGKADTHLKFDVNKYPQFKKVFDTLPGEIQDSVRPFISEVISYENALS